MLNDRDDKYEGQDESEYHFSDEDAGYEVEAESPKTVVASEQKENILNRLTRSKRMLISVVVFVGLIFVVYKMVSPSATAPATEITPAVVTAVQQNIKTPPTQMMSTTPSAVVSNQQAPNNIQGPMPPATQQPVQATGPAIPPSVPVVVANVPAQTITGENRVQVPTMQQPSSSVGPMMQQPQNQNSAAIPSVPGGTTMPVVAQQPPMVQQQTPPQEVGAQMAAMPSQVQQQNMPAVPAASMPAIMPVQSVMSSNNMNQPMPGSGPPGMVTTPTPAAGNVDIGMANMASESARLAGQLQADYAQKINDYAAQNKVVQDQLQTLNTRVASMESQMLQLIQALTQQQHQRAQSPANAAMPAHSQAAANEPRIAYNVQAIIPGRAWLRSDSGETVTVAEGDIIKDIGRVTKIDPYDGVVEINTGNRVVSLSYGNGG